jgi:hypothetical protein
VYQRLNVEFLEFGASCLDHAVGDTVIPGGFIRVQFFDFILEFMLFNVRMKERVARKDRVLYLV